MKGILLMEEQPSFKESLDNAVVEINESTTLKVLLEFFGWGLGIPNVLGLAASDRAEAITKARLEDFLYRVQNHIKSLEEDTVTMDYLESPEWFDLFRKASEEALKTRSDDKREYYARILKGAIKDSQSKRYSPEEYLNVIVSLTEKELQVARTLYDLQRRQNYRLDDSGHPEGYNVWQLQAKKVREKHSLDESDLQIILGRVAATSLLELVYTGFVARNWPMYWASPAFDKVLRFLEIED